MLRLEKFMLRSSIPHENLERALAAKWTPDCRKVRMEAGPGYETTALVQAEDRMVVEVGR